jgi:uncharacterized protein (TIGR03435 family)
MHYNDFTMSNFAERIAGFLGGPIQNETGLNGKYDILLYWVTESSSQLEDGAGPILSSAIQSQLGLKLEPNKTDVSVLVVDHADKAPTEN